MVSYGSTQTERTVMARALALLFTAGGALVLITLVLPRADGVNVTGMVVMPVLAFVVAATLVALGPRVSVPALQGFLVGGSILITGCIVYGGENAVIYPTLYVLVSSYAFFFFRLRAAVVQIAAAGALYALALLTTGDGEMEAGLWVLVMGTIAAGGVLIGRLVAAVRSQAADVAAVSQMAGGSDATAALRATCEGIVAAIGADVAIMLEPAPDANGLTVAAMAGSAEGGLVFTGERARAALEQAFKRGEPALMETDEAPRGLRRFDGTTLGLAQPVLRDNAAVAVLAVAWTAPRRGLPERARSVALLFAAEASLALDRAEQVAQDRERQALEINDNIVQGLVVAKYSAQRGNVDGAIEAIEDTLVRARKLISDQLSEVVGSQRGIRPGDLARREAAGVNVPGPPPPQGSPR